MTSSWAIWCMVHVVQHIQIRHAWKMRNAQRDIHRDFVMKWYWMKMVIQSINDDKLLKENDAKSNAKVYGSIINGLFHTVHTFPNITMLISMSKSARALAHSNTFSNTYLRVNNCSTTKWSQWNSRLCRRMLSICTRSSLAYFWFQIASSISSDPTSANSSSQWADHHIRQQYRHSYLLTKWEDSQDYIDGVFYRK